MRGLILVGALLLSWPFTAYAENVRVDKVISVYDADTFRVDIAGWPDIVGKNMSVRVNGVDAAEIRGKCEGEKQLARQARDFTRQFLANGQVIELRNIQRGKYFRLLADVYVDGHSLTDALLQSGLARPYDGGSRQGWC
ncbi:thermonuclease family protein [Maribrevibacterium harenarium]|uniref:Thermonuclease family protein n=1 Tax=Maribrevibacterium harenarium TaxID=2589817 RepID=A0A501X551_9GAMM|nr:thermonuclease family protein [Maribrevibacterium harenarium]TPE55645.1 thermonuclease family protein [Maribrevibacterium harenarium]